MPTGGNSLDKYTGLVDSYLGQLSPEELQQYRTAQRLSGFDTFTDPKAQAALSTLKSKFGWDDSTAQSFLLMSQGVIKGQWGIAAGAANAMGIDPSLDWEATEKLLRSRFGDPGRMSPEDEAAAKKAAEEPGRRNISAQIQAFVDSMTGDMAPNDPIRMQLVQAGTDAAQKAAGRQGISGRSTAVGTQAASVAQQNLVPYQAQRATLANQGLGLMNQRDIGLGQLEQGRLQLLNQQAQTLNEQAAAKWAAEQNQAQGIGSAIGTGLGALGFIGGPALGAATMGAGAALGGGLGGLVAGGSGPRYASAHSLGGSKRGVNIYTGS